MVATIEDAKAFAARLNGREYGDEMTDAEDDEARKSGLVVVFGASDDLVEFRGAIHEERGSYGGDFIRVCRFGLLEEWEDHDDWAEADAEDFFRRKASGFSNVKTIFDSKDPDATWAYETDIPHATFDVMDAGELYCRGIVFALADVGPENPSHNPWTHAKDEGRDYMTPKDISAAIDAGADRAELQRIVLEALGRKVCEDWSLCAFVAAKFEKSEDHG